MTHFETLVNLENLWLGRNKISRIQVMCVLLSVIRSVVGGVLTAFLVFSFSLSSHGLLTHLFFDCMLSLSLSLHSV